MRRARNYGIGRDVDDLPIRDKRLFEKYEKISIQNNILFDKTITYNI